MEREVSRAGAGRRRERLGARSKPVGLSVQMITISRPRSVAMAKLPGSVSIIWACGASCPLLAKLPGARSPRWLVQRDRGRTNTCRRPLLIRRRPERATGEDGNDRAISAAVVRHQDVATGGVHAQVSRSPASGADRVQERQLAINEVDSEGADRASRWATEIADLVGDIEMGLARIERQPGRVGWDTLVGDGLGVVKTLMGVRSPSASTRNK